jgi:hypothetical protein
VLLDLGGNDIAVQGGGIAEVAFQVCRPEEPALDNEKVCDFGSGHFGICDLRLAIYELAFLRPGGWQPNEPSSHAVREGVFFDVKADFGFWGRGWRLEQRAELLKDLAERGVVEQQGFVNLGQAPEDGGVGGEVLAHFDEGANDVQAHGNSAGAVENRGRHQGAVFGEGVRQITPSAAPGL